MRWGRKQETSEFGDSEPMDLASTRWAERFAGIGAKLDRSGSPLTGLAISVTGDQTAISVLELGGSRYHSGWSPVDMTVAEPPISHYSATARPACGSGSSKGSGGCSMPMGGRSWTHA